MGFLVVVLFLFFLAYRWNKYIVDLYISLGVFFVFFFFLRYVALAGLELYASQAGLKLTEIYAFLCLPCAMT